MSGLSYSLCAVALPLFVGAMLLLFRIWRGDSPVRVVTGNLAILLCLLWAAFLVGEGYFYFDYDTTDGSLALLSSRRWVDRHVRVNGLEFRDESRDPREAGRPGDLRICVMGDSIAFGQGIARVEDRFSGLLERALRESGVPATVFNVSLPGWGTQNQLEQLAKFSREGIGFDMLILQYCLNDHFYLRDQPAGYREAMLRVMEPPPLVEALIGRSYFLSFLYHRLTTFRNPELRGYEQMALDLFRRPSIRDRHRGELDMVRDYCARLGMHLAVLIFPFTFDPWDRYPLGEMHRALDGYWKAAGVPYIDLLDDFSKRPVDTLTVGRWDRHPNELANRIAAERMQREWFTPPGTLLGRPLKPALPTAGPGAGP